MAKNKFLRRKIKNNTKTTKRALLSSVVAMLVCITMLIGTTFAWFTDSASTAVNKIQAGNLDVQLLMYDGTEYVDISDDTREIFGTGSIAQNNNAQTLWEPGKTQVAYLAIKNNGNLALKYKVALDVTNVSKNLYEVMEYAITPDATNTNPVTAWTTGNSVVVGTQVVANDVSLAKDTTHYFALSVHMKEDAGNTYQNGEVNFDLTVYAAQLSSEADSFDNTYDMWAEYDQAPPAPPVVNVGGAQQLREALEELNTTGTINLTQDIDLAGVNWESPTMSYTSPSETITINGNGYTIKNLTSTGSQYGGLIGKLTTNGNVEIKNIKLENVKLRGTNVNGECAGGALIGWMECHDGSITIENVTVKGVDIDGFKYRGGLIGYRSPDAYPITIKDCTVTGTDTAKTINSSYNESDNYKGHIGGLVGYFGNGELSNCTLRNIAITRGGAAEKDRAGVLVGTLVSSASVTSATVSNVTLLGTPVTTTSNMAGPGDSATGNISGVTVQ